MSPRDPGALPASEAIGTAIALLLAALCAWLFAGMTP